MVAGEATAQQVWRWDYMEWEEAFEMVSPELSALWASANVRMASLSWAHWIASVQTFGQVYLWGGVFYAVSFF